MANLKLGMRDSEKVKELQNKLISAGYNVGATGNYGSGTEGVVKKFQKDNNLTVDGIAGEQTLGALNRILSSKKNAGGNTNSKTESQKTNAVTPKTSPAGFTYGDFSYDPFAGYDDPVVKEALSLLNQNSANKPGAWVDPHQDQYMGYLNQYENRGPFSYDFNSDALYQQYKDQYIQQGQMAMMDAMGQAAAMSGGYGSSYAQTVGQQAYDQYLGQLNAVMPELYGMAYDRYQQEGQEMLDMYGIYRDLSDQSFSRYQTDLDNWYKEDARLTDNLNTLYGQAYDNYLLGYNTALDEYSTDRSEAFSKWQTEQSQAFTASENEKDRAAASVKDDADAEGDKLNKMSLDDQDKYRKKADKAVADGGGVDALYAIGESLEYEGYSDAFIEKWIESEIERLFPQQPKVTYQNKGGTGTGGGRVGLGAVYNVVK